MKQNVWIINHYAADTYYDKGGRHYWFAKYLKNKGYNPVLFVANSVHGKTEVYNEDIKLWKEIIEDDINVPYVFVKSRPYMGNGVKRVLNMFDFYINVMKTIKEYSKRKNVKPDIIIASSVHPLSILAGIQIAKKFSIKCIGEIRDLWPESLIDYNIADRKSIPVILLRKLEKWLYCKADSVIFTMEGAYDYIVDQGWDNLIPKDKVFYINNGIDYRQFRGDKQKYRIQDDDLTNGSLFKVVYTGSIRKVNNLDRLIDVAKKLPSNIKILVWGDGEERLRLIQRVEAESVSNIVFKGRVEKKYIPFITSCADVNLVHGSPVPILRYGISLNKMFDALAAGKPVIVDFPCQYNPITINNAGIMIDKLDVEDIAKGIRYIYSLQTNEYSVFCDNAIKTAEKYDFEKLTDRLIEIIER